METSILINILLQFFPFLACLLFWLIFLYIIRYFSKSTYSSSSSLLKKVFDVQHFSDIRLIRANGMEIVNASAHGENYIFGIRNNMYFSINDINAIHHISERDHIHNVIIVTSSKTYIRPEIETKIKEYNMEIWDDEKLNSLLDEANSTLKTSDTSDDTCEIEKDSFDPIDDTPEVTGLFDNIFDKPDRL